MPEPDKTLKIDIANGSAVEIHHDAKTIVVKPEEVAKAKRKATAPDDDKTADEFIRPRKTGLFKSKFDIDELIAKTTKPDILVPSASEEIKLDAEDLECRSNVADRYEKLEEFAEGGHGTISLAQDKSLKRLVALKSLKHEFLDERKIVDGFIAEARLTAQLEHPSVAPIYSMERDSSDGLHLAMKLIRGRTLKDYLAQIIKSYNRDGVASFDERKSLSFRLDVFLRVCDALSYAHSRNVMHCDLKPENIMIGEYRETYLMDWGIARLIKEPGFEPSKWVKPKSISGTPRYLSPEAVNGEHTDHRADIYALGLILFELTALRGAVSGNDNMEVLTKIRNGEIDPLRHRYGASIDADLKAIIFKALETDRERRYQSVAELSEDVRRYLRFAEVRANPDNFPRKCVRWLYSHRTAFSGAILLALLVAATSVAFALYEKMSSLEITRERETKTNQAHSRTMEAGFLIDRLALHIESELNSIAEESSFLLRWEHKSKVDKAYSPSDLANDATAPEDLVYAPVYRLKISPGHFVYKAPPGMTQEAAAKNVQRLAPMGRKLPYAVLESFPGVNVSPSDLASAKRELLSKGCPARWIYIGLEDGFFMSYPGKSSYPESYDPRLRPWYKAGRSNVRARWESPYIDTGGQGLVLPCASAIMDDDDKLYGVVGMDVAFDYIVQLLNSEGNPSSIVKTKYLLNQDGNVIVSTDPKMKNLSFEPGTVINDTPKLPQYPDMPLFRRMSASGFGTIIESRFDGEVLHSFASIKALSLLYVEDIDFQKLLETGLKPKGKAPTR